MKRYCLINKIKKEYLNKYIDLHKNPWKDVLDVLKAAGTQNELIFMYEDLAIIYLECEDIEEYLKSFGGTDAGRRWFEVVAPWIAESQCIDATGKTRSDAQYLGKVFDLNQQLKGKLEEF